MRSWHHPPRNSVTVFSASTYARLPTEQANPRTRDIDRLSSREIVRLINAEDRRVPEAVARVAKDISRGIDCLAKALSEGGSVLIVGAGTSGRLAVLEAAECPPTFNTHPDQIRAVIAGGTRSVFKAKEGAEDDPSLGRRAAAGLRAGDVLVGVAASGVTPFVRAALAEGKRRGATTVLVTSNGLVKGRPADIIIAPDVGPEVVTGSTRMKSGTAAKLVLNTLTTGAMIKIGKVHDHWMVDLRPNSHKLRLRAQRIVVDLARVSPAQALRLLKASGDRVKVAVVMSSKSGLTAAQARHFLSKSNGILRDALRLARNT